jgi:hypothetical protein
MSLELFSDITQAFTRRKKKIRERVNMLVSIQLKDELQVSLLLTYLRAALSFLLERVDGSFPSLLADRKDLDVDNSLVP